MTEKRKESEASETDTRRKRATPTIDLTATEVSASTGSASSNSQSNGNAETSTSSANYSEPSAGADASMHNAASPEDETRTQQTRTGRFSFAVLTTGFITALVVFVFAGVLWFTGMLSPREMMTNAQFADLQKQLQESQRRLASLESNNADKRAIDALTIRVGKIESNLDQQPASDSQLGQRVTAAETAVKTLDTTLAALTKRYDELAEALARTSTKATEAEKAVAQLGASMQAATTRNTADVNPSQLSGLSERVVTIEQSLKSVRESLNLLGSTAKSLRFALGVNALRAAVERGALFQDELKRGELIGIDKATIASLEPFAKSGLPSAQELASELHDLIPAMESALPAPNRAASFFEKLQTNAAKLVRIQRLDAPNGDDPSSVLARIQSAAAQSDLQTAVVEIGQLPVKVRELAQVWTKKVQARQNALIAVQSLAARATNDLGSE